MTFLASVLIDAQTIGGLMVLAACRFRPGLFPHGALVSGDHGSLYDATYDAFVPGLADSHTGSRPAWWSPARC
jgi:hypothetical protein